LGNVKDYEDKSPLITNNKSERTDVQK